MHPDATLAHWLNALAGRAAWLDRAVILMAQWGPVPMLLPFAWLWFAPAPERRRRRRLAVYAAVGTVVALAVAAAIGAVWNRPRPFVALGGTIVPLVRHGADASFPSDHATVAFALAAGLAAAEPSFGAPALVWAVLVALARVMVGVHWPSDVVGGAALGYGAVRLALARAGRWDAAVDRVLGLLGPLGRDESPG